jgi:GxxExxY protein
LQYELALRKRRYADERSVAIVYKGITLDTRYRIDLIVEDTVVVEVKSIGQILPVHKAQSRAWLRQETPRVVAHHAQFRSSSLLRLSV